MAAELSKEWVLLSAPALRDRRCEGEGSEWLSEILSPCVAHLMVCRQQARRGPKSLGDKLASAFPVPNRELVAIPENRDMLIADFLEGYRQAQEGPAQDDITINAPCGVGLHGIRQRIDVWQDDADRNVLAARLQ